MSKTGNKQVVKVLQARDIEILKGLYEHRALSTEQIMRRYEMYEVVHVQEISIAAKQQIDQHTSDTWVSCESEATRELP